MKLDIDGIIKGKPSAMADFMSAVKKSAHMGCAKAGAESIEDDVAQEVAMLFLNRLIEKFDPSYNAEPLLIETSRRVALAMMRKNKEVLVDETTELHNEETNGINDQQGDVDENPVSYLDQQKALQEIRMSGAIVADSSPTAEPHKPRKQHARVDRALSPSCARLREIRTSLGMSQESFSSQLGIPTATLLSYEYGRTPNVPPHILEQAEEIYKRELSVAKRNQAQADRPMQEIVQEWAEMLMVDPNDYKTIADIIGVAKSTVIRWVKGEMRPRPRELNAYIRAVKVVAKRIRSGSKAIEEYMS